MALGRKLLTKLLAEKEDALHEMLREVVRLRAALAAAATRYDALDQRYQIVVRQLNRVPQTLREGG